MGFTLVSQLIQLGVERHGIVRLQAHLGTVDAFEQLLMTRINQVIAYAELTSKE